VTDVSCHLTQQEIIPEHAHSGPVFAMAMHAAARVIVSGGKDGRVIVWRRLFSRDNFDGGPDHRFVG
jgi:hypothetical protein